MIGYLNGLTSGTLDYMKRNYDCTIIKMFVIERNALTQILMSKQNASRPNKSTTAHLKHSPQRYTYLFTRTFTTQMCISFNHVLSTS